MYVCPALTLAWNVLVADASSLFVVIFSVVEVVGGFGQFTNDILRHGKV